MGHKSLNEAQLGRTSAEVLSPDYPADFKDQHCFRMLRQRAAFPRPSPSLIDQNNLLNNGIDSDNHGASTLTDALKLATRPPCASQQHLSPINGEQTHKSTSFKTSHVASCHRQHAHLLFHPLLPAAFNAQSTCQKSMLLVLST